MRPGQIEDRIETEPGWKYQHCISFCSHTILVSNLCKKNTKKKKNLILFKYYWLPILLVLLLGIIWH